MDYFDSGYGFGGLGYSNYGAWNESAYGAGMPWEENYYGGYGLGGSGGGGFSKGWAERFNELTRNQKIAVVGGVVAVGAAIGYWVYTRMHEKADQNKQSTVER